jgi:hypothetical protein
MSDSVINQTKPDNIRFGGCYLVFSSDRLTNLPRLYTAPAKPFSTATNKLNVIYVVIFVDSRHLGAIDGFPTVNFRQNTLNNQSSSN